MLELLSLFVFFTLIYFLFVRGMFWKIIIGGFGWVGLNSFLEKNFTSSKSTFMTILNLKISWAVFLPTLIIILAMLTTVTVKEE